MQAMGKKQKAPKEKRRNNEKRKEKSRNAARCRRSKETELYYDLANALPYSNEQVSQLDKASVMRLAISYLKVRNMIGAVPDLLSSNEDKSFTDTSTFLKTLDGFVIILSEEGDFIYLSENVHEYLGITQIDLMGQNIFEYTHPCDHDEIRDILSGKMTADFTKVKSLFIRMKCTLTSKGRSVTLKSAVYKVIHSTGHTIKYENLIKKEEDDPSEMKTYFISVNQPIPHPSNIESPLPKQTFLTKHSLDMKFTNADDEFMKEILGYEPDDLLGKSAFDYHHGSDSELILSSYKCLFSKGQSETEQYRFLAKSGGYVWIITQATLIYDKNHKPQSVVCVNYVTSGLECEDQLYSSTQYSSVKSEINNNNNCPSTKVVPDIVVSVDENVDEKEVNKEVHENRPISNTRKLFGNPKEVEGAVRPRSATSKIFGYRTKDMSRGFLTFSDQEPGLTMLKDEPEDLTHLAPVAGDVCVPLEDHVFLPEMLDDIFLKDSLEPLLIEQPMDPFISYRNFQDGSPQLLSPNLSKHSECSLPSMNSPCDSLIDDDHTSAFINLQMDDDIEMLKHPYISINDESSVLVSTDLMWSSSEKKLHHSDNSSSLAQLLSNSVNKHQIKQNDHGGGILCKHDMDDVYNIKNIRKSWNDQNSLSPKSANINKLDRVPSTKRSNCNIYDHVSKKTRNDPKEKMSSELFQQLISNNHDRGRQRDKNNWLLKNGSQKAACVSQPSDSVLMNLLGNTNVDRSNTQRSVDPRSITEIENIKLNEALEPDKRSQLVRNSISLLDPEGSIASLMDLTQQDFEVNAPVCNKLLQGTDLLKALDLNSVTI